MDGFAPTWMLFETNEPSVTIIVSGNETNFNLKTVTVLLIIAGELRKKWLQFSVNLSYGNINKSCRSLQKKLTKETKSV